jgi:methyl-accepting chemotaxis protein
LAAVQQISSNLENMENLMVKQENGAEEAGNAVGDIKTNEEMTANIHSVTQTLVENSKNVGVLAEASENGKTGLQTVAQEIREITTHSH